MSNANKLFKAIGFILVGMGLMVLSIHIPIYVPAVITLFFSGLCIFAGWSLTVKAFKGNEEKKDPHVVCPFCKERYIPTVPCCPQCGRSEE